jgi:hypothetical protein
VNPLLAGLQKTYLSLRQLSTRLGLWISVTKGKEWIEGAPCDDTLVPKMTEMKGAVVDK